MLPLRGLAPVFPAGFAPPVRPLREFQVEAEEDDGLAAEAPLLFACDPLAEAAPDCDPLAGRVPLDLPAWAVPVGTDLDSAGVRRAERLLEVERLLEDDCADLRSREWAAGRLK